MMVDEAVIRARLAELSATSVSTLMVATVQALHDAAVLRPAVCPGNSVTGSAHREAEVALESTCTTRHCL